MSGYVYKGNETVHPAGATGAEGATRAPHWQASHHALAIRPIQEPCRACRDANNAYQRKYARRGNGK